MRRALCGLICLAVLTSGCATFRRGWRPAAEVPSGIVGVVRVGFVPEESAVSFEFEAGAGFFVAPDLMLVSAHQVPWPDAQIPDELLKSPAFLPVLLMGSHGRLGGSAWSTVQMVGLGTRAVKLVGYEERVQEGGERIDAGWALLRVWPAYEGACVRMDFERELHAGDEVVLYRSGQYPELGAGPDDRVITLDRGSLGEAVRYFGQAAQAFGPADPDWRAWRGRVTERWWLLDGLRGGAEPAWVVSVGLDGRGVIPGASGGPLMVRDEDGWVAVGIVEWRRFKCFGGWVWGNEVVASRPPADWLPARGWRGVTEKPDGAD